MDEPRADDSAAPLVRIKLDAMGVKTIAGASTGSQCPAVSKAECYFRRRCPEIEDAKEEDDNGPSLIGVQHSVGNSRGGRGGAWVVKEG